MTTKTWNFTLEGQLHTLTLEHGVFSGKRSILLDGQLLDYIPRNLVDSGSVHPYEVGGHSVVVVIQSKVASFVYDLLVDGVSLTTGARGPQRVGNTTMQGTIALVVLMVFIVGPFISWLIKSNYDDQFAIQEWPVVTGEVTNVSAARVKRSDDNGTYTYYYPLLTVEYVVSDSRFTVQLRDYDRSYKTDAEAVSAHTIGESQTLYVNPANPQEARLYFEKMDPNGWIGSVLGVMGMFTVLSLIILVAVWFQTRNSVPVFERL